MNTRAYDTLKAVVAIILLVILLWRVFTVSPAPVSPVALPGISSGGAAQGITQATSQGAYPAPGPSPTLEPYPAPAEVTQVAAPTQPAPTPTAEPTALALAPAATAEPTTAPTAAPTPEPAPTAAVSPTAAPAAAEGCPLALPTRLKPGDTARVTSRLHLRAGSGITQSILLTNPVGTRLTVVGGPVCEPYQNRAYLWWQVRTTDGQEGWSAEGSTSTNFYFLQPVE